MPAASGRFLAPGGSRIRVKPVQMKVTIGMSRPLLRRALAIFAGLLVFWAIAGFLILPRLLRPVAERKLSESLHRPVTLRARDIHKLRAELKAHPELAETLGLDAGGGGAEGG